MSKKDTGREPKNFVVVGNEKTGELARGGKVAGVVQKKRKKGGDRTHRTH